MAIGIDQNRLALLLAVLEKRAGLSLAGDDVYVNIAGGMSIEEPAADLSVVAAVASSVRNRGLSPSTAVFGEVGLSGEIRGIPQAPLRIREAVQMGFTRVVLPVANLDSASAKPPADRPSEKDCELIGVRTVGEALDTLI
jgi:DNA repair protein RadA/Sms